ncbi:ATP-binding protein [Thiothrix winogradskyi]|uniref:ATP-binding protein n=1 Tax=Thiothrix winogradskyi TaxID=96472 RepID=A0ABY3T224_9GAMM|nr:ATP-binding protein [Thiothrix winogradskyi]UJS25594.1 ATP-binding protein [Thiothrix winogradskyi]
MITRHITSIVQQALNRQAAVALIGPRQVGKTTLAYELADTRPSLYLDLESPADRNKLSDPELFLGQHEDKLVILDEIHRVPELFQSLRGLIDKGRRIGKRTGRFLILGSASIDLLRQSSETLAGRIEYVDMGPLDIQEAGESNADLNRLWLRGGFPDSYLAANDRDSLILREAFIRTYLERDVPQFGFRIPTETVERLWTMLAHQQGGLLNVSQLAASLGVSSHSVNHYIGLLMDLLLVRRLQPYHANVGKRLVKSPRVYIRDSGLVHALLRLGDLNTLAGHPVVGASWEGFVIENLLAAAPRRTQASFYRTAAGAEMDLVLELGGEHGLWAIEVKRSLAPAPSKGFHHAREDLQPARTFIVYPGQDRYPLSAGVEVISLRELAGELTKLP